MKTWMKVLLIVAGSLTLLFVGLMVLVISVAMFSDTEESTSTIEPIEEVQAEDLPEEETVKPTVIGEDLQVGNVIFKVNELSRDTNVGGEWGVNSKGEFLIASVSVTNRGSEAITIDSSYFNLLLDGKTYEADSSAGIYANEANDFFYEKVNPDLTMTGYVVFDIPSEMHEKDLTLQVQTGAFGTETGVIELK